MSLIEIKQLLHSYVDSASEQDVEALLTFIEENRKASQSHTEIELNEYYKRKNFLNNCKKGYSTDEVHGFIRQMKGYKHKHYGRSMCNSSSVIIRLSPSVSSM